MTHFERQLCDIWPVNNVARQEKEPQRRENVQKSKFLTTRNKAEKPLLKTSNRKNLNFN